MERLMRYLTNWFNNRRFAIWSASILALVIRLATSFALETYKFNPVNDHKAFGYEWGRIAKWLVEINMFSLDGSTPNTFMDPVYVFVIAPFFHVFGSFSTSAAIALIVFQSLLCALSTWAIFVLAEKLYGPFEARLSSLLFAFYPASIFLAVGRIGPSSLSILILSLIFIVVLALANSPRPKLAVLAGFLMGLLVLTSSKTLSLFLIIPLWLLYMSKGQRARMILASLIFIGSATLIILPWSVRNSIVLEQPSLTKTGLGKMLWIGNNPGATGDWKTAKRPDIAFEGEQNSQPNYLQMAISWAANNPKDFLVVTLKRIKYFWYRTPSRNTGKDLLHAWIFITVLGLAVCGAFWPGEKNERIGILLLYFTIFPILFYLTIVTFHRHRFHIEPFLIIVASHGLHRLWTIFPKGIGHTQRLIRKLANGYTDHSHREVTSK
jgi:hypothetical protein